MHSLVWDEAQKIAGKDPDFHRRDLWEAIERGDYPEWELGVQIVEEEDEFKFDFDLLDPTKIIPEELVPVRTRRQDDAQPQPRQLLRRDRAGRLPHRATSCRASTSPTIRCCRAGCSPTSTPSSRRVGPNFAELPINRPIVPGLATTSATAMAQHDDQPRAGSPTSPTPSAAAARCTRRSGAQAFRSYAEKMDGAKIRERSHSFNDHFSQATLFWNSMADWEKHHIADAFAFELNQVESEDDPANGS